MEAGQTVLDWPKGIEEVVCSLMQSNDDVTRRGTLAESSGHQPFRATLAGH